MSARRSRFARAYFARPTLDVARDLLGARLVRQLPSGERLVARVVEVEAYVGAGDSACHAARGRTPRNDVMFGPPGWAYVYFTYGMHWMLNVVTERAGVPAAVLVRAAEPLTGIETMRRLRVGRPDRELTAGPARLTRALAIDGALDRHDLVRGDALWLCPGEPLPASRIASAPRIGIDYARPADRERPWRLFDTDSPYVSAPRTRAARGR